MTLSDSSYEACPRVRQPCRALSLLPNNRSLLTQDQDTQAQAQARLLSCSLVQGAGCGPGTGDGGRGRLRSPEAGAAWKPKSIPWGPGLTSNSPPLLLPPSPGTAATPAEPHPARGGEVLAPPPEQIPLGEGLRTPRKARAGQAGPRPCPVWAGLGIGVPCGKGPWLSPPTISRSLPASLAVQRGLESDRPRLQLLSQAIYVCVMDAGRRHETPGSETRQRASIVFCWVRLPPRPRVCEMGPHGCCVLGSLSHGGQSLGGRFIGASKQPAPLSGSVPVPAALRRARERAARTWHP